MIKDTLALLGLRATDRVTGFSGVVATISFDLYGCVQAVLSPPVGDDGKPRDGHWFDVQRLELDDRVMDAPDFGSRDIKPAQYDRGPAEKPAFESKP